MLGGTNIFFPTIAKFEIDDHAKDGGEELLPKYTTFFNRIPIELLTLSDLGDLKQSMPGGGRIPPPCLSLLLLEIWQPNLAQRLLII